ncbi:hypothetical protein CH341_23755 [Rhodoplanes roseus]|uniref:DUF3489 domain-containing protein n=2 Tax=Rhodoplanes roseus TaxID=29409 RepID=A0A327KNK4_9BRAD|nr:hypothetical protein CH341_23755 [Rhodoplanes roseus]
MQKSAAKLLGAGLLEEVRARGTLPIWRRDESKGPLALRITRRGLKAIRVDDEPRRSGGASHKKIASGLRRRVAAAERGDLDKTARGRSRTPAVRSRAESQKRTAEPSNLVDRETRRTGAAQVHRVPASRRSRADSKQAYVITMLQRPEGATITAIMEVTGWRPHSVRGFLSAVVRKSLGLTLASDKGEHGRVYRIVCDGAAVPNLASSEQGAA